MVKLADSSLVLVAYGFRPGPGSEPALGYEWTSVVSKLFGTVHVVTRRKNLELQGSLPGNVHLHSVDFSRPVTRAKSAAGLSRPYYAAWVGRAGRTATRLADREETAIIHHLTWTSLYRLPSLTRSRHPYIVGPVSGLERAEHWFSRQAKTDGLPLSFGRRLSDPGRLLLPRERRILREASVVLGATKQTTQRLRALSVHAANWGPPVGLRSLPSSFQAVPSNDAGLVYVSRLTGWRGPHLAMRLVDTLRVHFGISIGLTIVGTGSAAAQLRQLRSRLGLDSQVEFVGQLDLGEVHELFDQSLALVHLSQADPGSWVAAQALSAGLPVVCFSGTGPSELLTPELSRFAIRGSTLAEALTEAAASVCTLQESPEMWRELARQAATLRTWDAQESRICSLYESALPDSI
jgi:glycosyltransferase involved in cell wall biosynthesis